ncbi:2-oxoacid:acceptor oxidoreductase family protein [Chitinophaga sedimenti]|nr:2-oxoacid:acceptor oxidoreductase family protein [Chitinophaga sedimenti]MCK7557938.1 2-oxoacid:acceptor oxidoreductase family protein [Chitinophaga sedimenti]
MSNTSIQQIEDVVIKFAGDSGDGMQLTGSQFSNNTALVGNDLSTFPDFPAEIRAPQGTLAGVSGFQLHFSSNRIFTPGDACDVLVAMNAAALKANLKGLKKVVSSSPTQMASTLKTCAWLTIPMALIRSKMTRLKHMSCTRSM